MMDGPKVVGTVACSAVLSAATTAACWVVDWVVQRVVLTDSSWAVQTAETKAVLMAEWMAGQRAAHSAALMVVS